ncbi:DUF3618 domain-containing protein [Nocardioides daphniae]|uniref:DUF3618 domain-containing protein n=1 Tax=Nocardioides daphniae TaxID=402297 RepID=A0A4P7UCR3_9ACTN|nr:DUF3618 domain-containing protein [Nocardioides daphniae]QCC77604.1 DUF3618 domain-containing protein [Nocardioides daphniae]GGD30282.1 hypothetical protein GCM10007231_32190 [Nocardioides daphniae]
MSDINDRTSGADGGRHRQNDPTDGDPRVAELQADIEQTREQLAQTVDQLQAKLDVKARASASAHETAEKAKQKVLDNQGNPRPEAIGAAVAGVLALVLVVLWRQRARRRTTGRR